MISFNPTIFINTPQFGKITKVWWNDDETKLLGEGTLGQEGENQVTDYTLEARANRGFTRVEQTFLGKQITRIESFYTESYGSVSKRREIGNITLKPVYDSHREELRQDALMMAKVYIANKNTLGESLLETFQRLGRLEAAA